MTLTAATALAASLLLSSAGSTAAQDPAVQGVMADYAVAVCDARSVRETPRGDLQCDSAATLSAFLVHTDGVRRTEVLIRWVGLVGGRCEAAHRALTTPVTAPARRDGAPPAAAPPAPPTPAEVISICDDALVWLARFEAAGVADAAGPDVAAEIMMTRALAHRARGLVMAAADGGPSARSCEAFAAARAATRGIDPTARYVLPLGDGLRRGIAEIEALPATCT